MHSSVKYVDNELFCGEGEREALGPGEDGRITDQHQHVLHQEGDGWGPGQHPYRSQVARSLDNITD